MKLFDLARMTVTGTPGTGAITLGSAVSGYLTFAQAGISDGDMVTYAILDGANCEIGRGKYTASGTSLARSRILRSTGSGNNTAISATSSATVMISAAAEDMVPAGAVMMTMATSAPDGWLIFDDGFIGDASSSASTRSSEDCKDVFYMLYNNFADSECAIQTSAGSGTTRVAQTDAPTAWAAHCRIALPKVLGRAIAVAGAGSGLTPRVKGKAVGEETHTPTQAEMFRHSHSFGYRSGANNGISGPYPAFKDDTNTINTASSARTDTAAAATIIDNNGSSTPFNVMQPTTFLGNAMVKL